MAKIAKATDETEVSLTLNEREIRLLACAFQSFKSPPDFDFEKLASLLGMTNINSAKNSLSAVRKRLDSITPSAGAKAPGPVTPKKGRPTKVEKKESVAAAKRQNEDEGDEPMESPTKKAKTGTKKVGAAKATKGKNGASKCDSSHDDTDHVKSESEENEVA